MYTFVGALEIIVGHRFDAQRSVFRANEILITPDHPGRNLIILHEAFCSRGSANNDSHSVFRLFVAFLRWAEEVWLHVNVVSFPPTRLLIQKGSDKSLFYDIYHSISPTAPRKILLESSE